MTHGRGARRVRADVSEVHGGDDSLESAHEMGVRIGAPDLLSLPAGPDTSLACVQFGIFPDQGPGGPPRDPESATLLVERNVFRGQVVAFGETPMGHRSIGMLVFYPRPTMSAEELVLPETVLRSIERHVLGIAAARERLRASGQHVKRGLLLHGPPGTGKTHIRYLMT